MNKIFLIGNLTGTPELSTFTKTNNEVKVCKFNIAVNRDYTDANGNKIVDYFPIVVWRALGESCAKFLDKGSKVCVEGSVEIRSYEGDDGQKRMALSVVADNVHFLSHKKGSKEGEEANEGDK